MRGVPSHERRLWTSALTSSWAWLVYYLCAANTWPGILVLLRDRTLVLRNGQPASLRVSTSSSPFLAAADRTSHSKSCLRVQRINCRSP
jgi:hypothetical protein